MEILGLLFVVVLASAADVEEASTSFNQSFLDVYASSSQQPFFHRVDIYQGPVIVLANTSQEEHSELVAYYADNGIRSIVDSQKFKPLHQLLRSSPNVSGLVIGYQGLGDNNFLLNVVSDFVLPDNFKLYDLVRESIYTVPVLYVASKEVFDDQNFEGLEHVASFVVDDFNIDQVPVKNYHNSPVVLLPIFTLGYPNYYKPSGSYSQHPGSSPFSTRFPPFYPYSYHGPNNRGSDTFRLYSPRFEYTPVGNNKKFNNRLTYSFHYTPQRPQYVHPSYY